MGLKNSHFYHFFKKITLMWECRKQSQNRGPLPNAAQVSEKQGLREIRSHLIWSKMLSGWLGSVSMIEHVTYYNFLGNINVICVGQWIGWFIDLDVNHTRNKLYMKLYACIDSRPLSLWYIRSDYNLYTNSEMIIIFGQTGKHWWGSHHPRPRI